MFASSVLALAAFAPFAAAQSSSNSSAFAGQLVQALQSLGLNKLATTAASIANTTRGQFLFNTLPNGNFTVFAPNDHAFVGLAKNISDSPDRIAETLSYHVLGGSFPAASFQSAPNVTIGRTLLNSSTFLEGDKNQVIALQKSSNGTVNVLNQNTPVKVLNTTTVQNLVVHIVDSVIDIPGPLSWTLAANNLTLFTAAARSAGILDQLETAHGITIFAPTDKALTTAMQQLGGSASNTTQLKNILLNHVVAGQSLYSPSFVSSPNATSAAGEPLSFGISNGTTVTSGNTTAQVTTPDLILWSGVVHIIDTVLANDQSNPQAAASASASASSAAAQSTGTAVETGPVGFTPSPTNSGSGANQTGKQSGGAVRVGASSALLVAVLSLLAL